MEFVVNGLTFTSKFDSGNLAKVEKVEEVVQEPCVSLGQGVPASAAKPVVGDDSKPDCEVNVWTSPDSAGTIHENKNRSWFYFGVRGGQSGKLLRVNVMNMNRQGRLYMQGHCSVFRFLPGKPKWERMRERPTFENGESNMTLSFNYRFTESKVPTTVYFAFTYPWSYADCQEKLAELDEKYRSCSGLNSTSSSAKRSIYYKRELLCYSLERQRVDLITISDCHGLTDVEEPRFDDKLFPNRNEPRCKWITGKKVYFVSSRVHPGETPSSFVFNGFLDFILREDDPRAVQLRKQYVFKLIPMLNPDGVSRGHYRSDSLGMNLNRVYLDPSFERHPTIYATKSLLVFHHVNNRIRASGDGFTSSTSEFWLPLRPNDGSSGTVNHTTTSNQRADPQHLPNTSTGLATKFEAAMAQPKQNLPYSSSYSSSHVKDKIVSAEHKIECITTEHSDSRIAAAVGSTSSDYLPPSMWETASMTASTSADCYLNQLGKKRDSVASCDIASGGECQDLDDEHPSNVDFEDERLGNEGSDDDEESMNITENVYSPHLADTCLRNIAPANSGIAFYVDLHAHASKRGCFIYGNYLENDEDQAQNVLFARLMAMNSAHFDFEACNFTERNMYSVDRKEGLSKEGSGRVALYKALGIIHCYTLECNYNCGRMVNSLPPAVGDTGRATPPPLAGTPPKYTPAHYEEVGRAMAVSALDMSEANPWSRVTLSEFACLQSLREVLRRQIQMARVIVSRATVTKPSKAVLKGTSGIGMIPRVAVLAARQNASQDGNPTGKTANAPTSGLQRKAPVPQQARKLSFTGGKKDVGLAKDVHRGAVAQAVDRHRQAGLSEALTDASPGCNATQSGGRAPVPTFAVSPRLLLTNSDKLGTQYSVGPKTFGVPKAEADLSRLPKVDEAQDLPRVHNSHGNLVHSRSAELVHTRLSDGTPLNRAEFRRSSSGAMRPISSTNRKLRNNLPITRSFVHAKASDLDQTLAAPRCSSLPGPIERTATKSRSPPSLTTPGYSSTMISDDFQMLNLNSAGANADYAGFFGTDAASLTGVSSTQGNLRSLFNMHGVPAPEGVIRLKLIPIATPSDDPTGRSLNRVVPPSSNRHEILKKKASTHASLTSQSKSYYKPTVHPNETCGNTLSANGTSCLTPVLNTYDQRYTPPHLSPVTTTHDAPEKCITAGTQTSLAKGFLPVRKSKTTGTKIARPRNATSLAESEVAASYAGGATAAEVVKSTGSKPTHVSREKFAEDSKAAFTPTNSAGDTDLNRQASAKNSKVRKRRRNAVGKKQQTKRKSDEVVDSISASVDNPSSASTSATSCI